MRNPENPYEGLLQQELWALETRRAKPQEQAWAMNSADTPNPPR